MAALPPSDSTTLAVWERFIRDGQLEAGRLRPEIASAWLRCREAGVDSSAGRSSSFLGEPELGLLRQKHRNLIDVALPFMKSLYQFVASPSFTVVLSDERGYLMEVVGEPRIDGAAPDLSSNFRPGSLWAWWWRRWGGSITSSAPISGPVAISCG